MVRLSINYSYAHIKVVNLKKSRKVWRYRGYFLVGFRANYKFVETYKNNTKKLFSEGVKLIAYNSLSLLLLYTI